MEGTRFDDHKAYMERAISLARKSPPKPTNYRVGALLVDLTSYTILTSGYTLELPGNTHAEQCCFMKLAEVHGVPEEALHEVTLPNMALYTTMEPCSKRLSGSLPCVERILRLKACIRTVYVGVLEPDTFIRENTGRGTLEEAGISVVHVEGFEKSILEVATAGHASPQ